MLASARGLAVYTLLAVYLGYSDNGVQAQSVGTDGCLRLLGSVACPGFQYAYVHPQNLSNAWPWLEGVTSVSQFDVAALNYFVNPNQFQQTKFVDQLGCTNSSGAVIRWERSVLCSQWVNSQWGRACTALYNGTSASTSQKMVCQSTCLQYSASERQIANNSTFCPGAAPTDGSREARLLKDYVDCTAWTTLATNNTETCVQGSQNEGNCGYGTSTGQLCDYCRGSSPDDCCYSAGVGQSVCGYELAARVSSSSAASSTTSSSSASASSSVAADQANAGTGNGTPLNNGQLAGVIVGSVLGGLLLLALLLLLLFCLRRRRRQSRSTDAHGRPVSGGGFSSMYGGSARGGTTNSSPAGMGGPMSTSEKALLGASGPGAISSPTMHSANSGSGMGLGQGGKGMMSSGSLGNGVAGAGTGLGIGAGAGAGALAGAAAVAGGVKGGRGGNVLPRVRDENQDGERFIEQGGEVTVLWPYTATLPDELDLRPGMRLRVVRLYDDAWGTGQVISSPEGGAADIGRQGAFPIVCVSEGSSFGSTSRSEESGSGGMPSPGQEYGREVDGYNAHAH